MSKTRISIAVGIVGLLLSGLAIVHLRSSREAPIGQNGGESLSVKIPCPVYKQNDDLWGSDLIGHSRCRLASYGCTISVLAMSLSAQGHTIDPGQLNQSLTAANGFTESGLLIWGSIGEAISADVQTYISNAPTYSAIDASISKGIPVIAKILIRESIAHWVLITGKEGNEYLIHDPLGSESGYEKISKFNSKIYRIRIVSIGQ